MAEAFTTPPIAPPLLGLPLGQARRMAKKRAQAKLEFKLVDSEEKIRMLLPHLDGMIHEGMITMESVRILAYRHNPADVPPAISD